MVCLKSIKFLNNNTLSKKFWEVNWNLFSFTYLVFEQKVTICTLHLGNFSSKHGGFVQAPIIYWAHQERNIWELNAMSI